MTGLAGAHWLAHPSQRLQPQDGAALGPKAAQAPGMGPQPWSPRLEVNKVGFHLMHKIVCIF